MKKKKNIVAAGIAVLSVGLLSGCGLIELTDAESRLVAGYAADVLIRYDKSYAERFAEEEETAENVQAEATVTEEPQPTENIQATPIPTAVVTEAPVPDDEVAPQNGKEESAIQVMSPAKVGEVFGLNGIEIRYVGYEELQSYPEAEAEQLAFQIEATSGNKLLIYSFDLSNVSASTQNCNLIGQNLKFRIRINGSDMLNAQKTLLLDDLSQMNLVMNVGETKRGVIVCQVSGDYSPQINSIELIVRTGGQDYTIPLQ